MTGISMIDAAIKGIPNFFLVRMYKKDEEIRIHIMVERRNIMIWIKRISKTHIRNFFFFEIRK
jgi:hypothetical protein